MKPLCLLLVLAILVAVAANEGDAVHSRSDEQTPSRDVLSHQVRQYDAQGQSAVEEALRLLREVRVVYNRQQKQVSRSSSFFGHVYYYAREILYALFINKPHHSQGAGTTSDTRHSRSPSSSNPKLNRAVQILEHAVEKHHNPDALYLLADLNFHGNYTYPRNLTRAFDLYSRFASQQTPANHSIASAQHMIGFIYATGIASPQVPQDQARAMLHHTFAAMAGDTRSQMTLAFQRYQGIGAVRDCEEAVYWYKSVADKAMQYYRDGPPGGRSLMRHAINWPDEQGGVYGEGASVASPSWNAQAGAMGKSTLRTSQEASMEDVMEYLDLLAKKGEIKAMYSLGKMHYDGTRYIPRNPRKAMGYFALVAKRFWGKDGKYLSNRPAGMEKIAGRAAAYIGLIFLRGENDSKKGIMQNFSEAEEWFKRGIPLNDPTCHHYLGLMHLEGYGHVQKDAHKAVNLFRAAADQDYAPAETRMGVFMLDQGHVARALQYFELAALWGNIEAYYHLAEMANQGLGTERHCSLAATYYKIVAEKAEALHSSFYEANAAYAKGDRITALVDSLMAAEQGYEVAQVNVAWLLDEPTSALGKIHDSIRKYLQLGRNQGEEKENQTLGHNSVPGHRRSFSTILQNPHLALIHWTRSAHQSSIDSLVKMGDYYYYGYTSPPDMEKAFACYQSAAEGQRSAQALWNLGYMYEYGIAVTRDFHLAKRYYDLALDANQESYLPVTLSLWKLKVRWWWMRVTGRGKEIATFDEDDEENMTKGPGTFKEWLATFLKNYDEQFDELWRNNDDDTHDGMRYRFDDDTDYPTGRSREHQNGSGSRISDSSDENSDHNGEIYLYDDEFDIDLFIGAALFLAVMYFAMRWYRRQRSNRTRAEQERIVFEQARNMLIQHDGNTEVNANTDASANANANTPGAEDGNSNLGVNASTHSNANINEHEIQQQQEQLQQQLQQRQEEQENQPDRTPRAGEQ